LKIADYKRTHGESTDIYMNTANTIYDDVAMHYDDTCGGGVWWTTGHTYKNAITNELFLYTSARGYQLTGNDKFLQNAQKTWTWLEASGMRNKQGLWNDGLDFNTCQNNGQNTWTYNQGVITAGLGALYAITGNTTLLDQAEITLDATISLSTVGGIIKEICDNASASTCDDTSEQFKGVFMKHFQYYLDNANDPNRTMKYSSFIKAQSDAALASKNSDNDIGSNWFVHTGSLFSPVATAAGLEAIVDAAKYGTC